LVDETWSRRRKVKPSISPLIGHNAGPPLDEREHKPPGKRKRQRAEARSD
jgi:hypothetical protein